MHVVWISAGMVALSEIGDKTQLLALLLASRFRAPLPIILGMLTATLCNHALAGLAGGLAAAAIDPKPLRWLLAVAFFAMALWMLRPDRLGDRAARRARGSAYLATVVSFFLAEMGDKTQIATAALAAEFGSILPVIAGTTLGMMAVDVPTVLFGHLAGERLDPRWTRYLAALCFGLVGVASLAGIALF